ncbi:MAG TPA: hypothetical protein VFW47_06910 [Phenylobacterium sp.]|nr:hypothetical protein [Phenylobacterium sp.]
MSGWYFHHLLTAAIALVAAFAWWKGAWPERFGASLNLLVACLFLVLQATMSQERLAPGLLTIDGVLGVGLLVLAIRYTSLWLGAAMLLQAAQFSLHAFYYVTAKSFDQLFAVVNNVVSWGILLAIVSGTCATWIQTRRAAAKATAP